MKTKNLVVFIDSRRLQVLANLCAFRLNQYKQSESNLQPSGGKGGVVGTKTLA